MTWLVKNLVSAVNQSEEQMDTNPKKEKKKRAKFTLCSSVDVMESSGAAPEDRDRPPSSYSSGKRRFKGLRRFFGRMLSFCRGSSSSSIQTQKTSDHSRAVSRSSEEPQKVNKLTAIQEEEAVGGADAALSSFESIDTESTTWTDGHMTLMELVECFSELNEASEERSSQEELDADQAALGLPNLGNTCYMNSIIQCILSVSSFREDLFSQQEMHTDSDTLIRALTDLHMSQMDGSDSDLKETHLAEVKSHIESHFPVFEGNYQQDAHEFLMACMACLKEECMISRLSHPSNPCPVSNMEFKLKTEHTCNSCGLKKCFLEESNYLSLYTGFPASLSDSLQQRMSASFTDCVCSLCDGDQATETLTFLTLPRVLVLLLQRFDYTCSEMRLKNRLEIPEELTLSCVKERTKQPESGENSRAGKQSLLQRIFRKKNRVAARIPQERGDKPPVIISSQYRLSAVVSHVGNDPSFGHYTSQIRERSDDGWLWCNDTSVRRSSWSEVSEDAGTNGYLLFYVQR